MIVKYSWYILSISNLLIFFCYLTVSFANYPSYRTLTMVVKALILKLLFYMLMYFQNSLQLAPVQFSSVQLLSHVWLFVTPWTAARQASLSITNSWSLLKLMSIELVMPSNRLILCYPLLLPSIFPSIRVFSNETALCIRWPKYSSFSFSSSPSNEYSALISFKIDWFHLPSVQGTLKIFTVRQRSMGLGTKGMKNVD